MKIAIPITQGKLAQHFGHCEWFSILTVTPVDKKILHREDVEAPPHEPGLLPPWLAAKGVDLIIAGGIGQRAQELFTARNIQVVFGASSEAPEDLVSQYLAGSLQTGRNICDH